MVPPLTPPPKEEDFFASHASPEVCVMLHTIVKPAYSYIYEVYIFKWVYI